MKKEVLKPIIKYPYDVKVECMLPATVTFRVLAETPEEALQLIKNRSPNHVQYKLAGRKDLVIRIYDAGSTMMRFIKRLINK